MLIDYKLGQASIVLRLKLRNSSVTTGAGLTGLTSASSGLIISTIANNEATATAYTVAAGNVETITTLGTFAAPTSGKCRFKEVDATNHPGVYEIQIADARFAVSSAKGLLVSVSGATNLAEADALIPLRTVDPYNANFGLTNLDASVSSRSTYSGGDTAGITTLVGLLTPTRAGYLDNLSAGAVSLASTTSAVKTVTDAIATAIESDGAGGYQFTTLALENAPSGGGGTDWTTTEKNQIRYRLGLDGTLATPTATPSLGTVDANVIEANGNAITTASAPANFSALAIDSSGRVQLDSAGLDQVVVETGVNARQALSPILAASAGLLVGAGTGTIVIKGGNVSTTRITATTDSSGNRTAVTLTLPT